MRADEAVGWPTVAGRMRRSAAAGVTALAAALLIGCVIAHPDSLRDGMTEADVAALMGPLTNRYAMPDGTTRLEFAQGPKGRMTWMVDLDGSGRVTKWDQVLDGWHFLKVSDGMDRDALLRTLGRPGDTQGQYMNGEIWYWRYYNNDCLRAVVSLKADGRVAGGVGQMPDPACDTRRF